MSSKSIVAALGCCLAPLAPAQTAAPDTRPEAVHQPHGNFSNNVARPLRYWPDAGDFVITNGPERFNRPLYAMNSGFRVDGGDLPEFSLYLPGRGGNVRFGLQTPRGTFWLDRARQIVTRYRAGSLLYTVRDPALGRASLDLVVLPLNDHQGFIVRAAIVGTAPSPHQLFFAYGGASGASGSRGGDIGCERQPVAQFFQFQPESCRDNAFTLTNDTFTLRGNKVAVAGVVSEGVTLALADAAQWAAPEALLASAGPDASLPVLLGRTDMASDQFVYFAWQSLPADAPAAPVYGAAGLPQVFDAAEFHRSAIARRVSVETPDPFINAAVPALCVAADAVWDEKLQAFMHGAVAWRTRLLGWRGPYAGDALGWHDRTAAHFAGFAVQQNTNPIPDTLPPADESSNLARSEAALHANGNFCKNHYDMNLVAVDAFFRHLLWTGDTNYARELWPVIERHFAWEQRLFRREFGPEKLPLYEAYAAIWASDDLGYNGGGTAHTSAYNYFANLQAARVAALLGRDPVPYQREAELIRRGMNKYLWLPEAGNFAECKDLLGLQRVHPNSGLWTFYHTVDAGVPQPAQAWRMSAWIDRNLAHIPITGPNVPDESLYTLPETSWLPYQWSLNNVVMAEAAHTALGFWQAGRPDDAFALFKGELLDSMFLGLCPGNLGCLTSHDMARGEAQRDFADAVGVNARALVEGLFGIRPDVLAGELKIVPGFPVRWDHAALVHPDVDFSWDRNQTIEAYNIFSMFPRPMKLNLQVRALGAKARVTVNGHPALWHWAGDDAGVPRIIVEAPAAKTFYVTIHWTGPAPAMPVPPAPAPVETTPPPAFDWTEKIPAAAPLETVNLAPYFNDQVGSLFRNEYRAPRSPYASLAMPKHGLGGWCEPNASFDVDDSGLRRVAGQNGDKIALPNGVTFATPSAPGAKNIIYTSQWENYPRAATVPLTGAASHAFLLMAGSTGPLQSRLDNGEVVVTYADGSTVTLPLQNPRNWWPIDQDYFTDDFAFRRDGPLPPRVDLATGQIRLLNAETFKGQGGKIPGGAATVLDLPLDPSKPLQSLTLRALANEVVIGLMGVTLQR